MPECALGQLFEELSVATQCPGDDINQLCSALRPFIDQEGDTDDVAEEDEEDFSNNRKRLRSTSGDRQSRQCAACEYERTRALNGEGFGQMFHTCL